MNPAVHNPKRILFIGDGGDETKIAASVAHLDPAARISFHIIKSTLIIGVLGRHIRYLRQATFAARKGGDFDKIIFWQQYIALYYFLITRLGFLKRRPYVVYYLLHKSRDGIIGRISSYVFMRMIEDPQNQKTYFMSASDHLFAKAQAGPAKARVEVLNSLDLSYPYVEENRSPDRVGETIFSGGNGNRRYADLMQVAAAFPGERFTVACTDADVAGLDIPANVEIYTDAYDERFCDLILESKLVVLPLADPNVMSGQVVCIRALEAGKPVILSENNCLRDWIPDVDQLDCISLYRNTGEFTERVRALLDSDLLAAGADARNFYEKRLTGTGFYDTFAAEIVRPIRAPKEDGAS